MGGLLIFTNDIDRLVVPILYQKCFQIMYLEYPSFGMLCIQVSFLRNGLM